MAQHCVFNQKWLVRGYLDEQIFHRGYMIETRLRTTPPDHVYRRYLDSKDASFALQEPTRGHINQLLRKYI